MRRFLESEEVLDKLASLPSKTTKSSEDAPSVYILHDSLLDMHGFHLHLHI